MQQRRTHGELPEGKQPSEAGGVQSACKPHPHLHRPPPTDTLFQSVCISGPVLSFLVGFRLVNAFVCTTAFVPDEYWQSLEVAHRMVFGYPLLMNIIN